MDDFKMTPAALVAAAKGDVANALIAASPGGIERQEAEGQRRLTSTFTTLPKDGMDRSVLENLGFTIGEEIDDLFVSIVAPGGWDLRPTEHPMHSDIVDDKGRVRGGVFYKAAFYDLKADMHLKKRYVSTKQYDRDEESFDKGRSRNIVLDQATDKAIWAGEWFPNSRIGPSTWEEQDALEQKARDELASRYPNHDDVTAYWDGAA